MSKPTQYRKRPVVVHAVRWDGHLATLGPLWPHATTADIEQSFTSDDLIIPTLEGEMRAEIGDWIICGIKGELYPCRDDIFRATYEPVEEDIS